MNFTKVASFLFSRHGWLVATAVLLSTSVSVHATIIVQGEGVAITVDDVLADAERIPDELRRELLSVPAKIEQLATNLYVRRVLAKRAADAALDKDPRIAAMQKIGSDKFLSELYLADAIAKIPPPDEAALDKLARAYYLANEKEFRHGEQRRVRHILIGKDQPQPGARAAEVLEKLQKGADFSVMATEYSDDAVTKNSGGDLGWFGEGRMLPSFERAAFALKTKGDLGGPVETPYGLHVIRLEGVRGAGKRPYDEVSADIKRVQLEKLAKERRAEILMPIQSSARADRTAIDALASKYR